MPIKSRYQDIDIPNVDIWKFLFERRNREFPDSKVIFLDPNSQRSYTYARVKDTAVQFGKGLVGLWEWRKGDVISLFTANSIDTPVVIWGAHWAGGTVSPANPGYTAEELAFQLRDARAKALVTQKSLLKVARKAAKIAGIPEDRIILIGDERDEEMRFKHFTSIRSSSETDRYRRAKTDPKKDVAFIVYSSGTTGYPKGASLSHENIVAGVLMLEAGEAGNLGWKGNQDNKGDRVLSFLPFYHIYGLSCLVHQAMHTGFELIVMSKFDIENFCLYIQKFKATFVYVVPPVVLLLVKNPVVNKYNLSSVRMMSSGGAPLTRELVEELYRRLKIPIKQGYGLSEASSTHIQPWERWNTSIGSVGSLLPNQTAKFVSEDGKEVPSGQSGELWIKGPNIFQGYINNAEETKNSLTSDGYLKTGDVGYEDEGGNLYITDRLKEIIKYKGFQVAPAELEGLLSCHPDIDDVAIIGIYDEERATEVPRAYIVPKGGAARTVETGKQIAEWLAQRVASHKRLRGGVRFMDEIPKSASGKTLRRVLKVHALKEEDSRAKL